MKSSSQQTFFQATARPRFIRLVIVAVVSLLATFHLYQVDTIGNESLFGSGCLFWMVLLYLLWQQKTGWVIRQDWISAILGSGSLFVLLCRVFTQPSEGILHLFPFVSFLSLSLLLVGWRGLASLKTHFMVIFFLGMPQFLIGSQVDISPITARVSAYMLWYSGFEVVREQVFLHLPGGSVEVYKGCSGMGLMLYMLGISVIFSVVLPLSRRKQIFAVLLALGLAFVINAIRVCLMAVLVSRGLDSSFDYWHLGQGSLLFSLWTVVLYGCLYIFLIRWQPKSRPSLQETVRHFDEL